MAYFRGIREEPWAQARVSPPMFQPGSPEDAVKRAAAEASGYTEVWVVCDVDDYFTEGALANARRSDVRLALSRPCFEVWLILHLIEGCGPFDNAAKAGERLAKPLPKWDKTDLKFDDFRAGVLEAEKRAKRLAETHGEPPEGNPSTDVWKVIESLRTPLAGQ
jgi:hypothetical protein